MEKDFAVKSRALNFAARDSTYGRCGSRRSGITIFQHLTDTNAMN